MRSTKKETPLEANTPLLEGQNSSLNQHLNSKHTIWLLGGLLGLMIVATISFFYIHSRSPLPQSYQGDLQKIRVAKIGVNPLLQTIAQNKGYFAQNGLEPVVTNYATGPQTLDNLIQDQLDIGLAADFAGVSYIFEHPELRIITSESQQDTFNLIVRTDKGITAPADLKGKKIGVTRKGAGEFFLARFLTLNNLSTQDIEILDRLPTDMSIQLADGTLDAVVLFEPSAFNLKKELGDKAQVWPIQGAEKVSAILFSTKDFIAARPDLIERYVRSLTQAQDFIMTDPQEAKTIMATAGNFSAEYVDYVWQKTTYNVSLQQSLLLTMEEQARFLISTQSTAQTTIPNYLDYMYFDALEKVKPNAISIIH